MINVGVIGLGRAGWNIHAANIRVLPGFRVAAVADPVTDRLNEAAAELGCRTYTDPLELANDPDLDWVVVASPSVMHYEHALAALWAGKNVIVDKPVAQSVAQMDALMGAARQAGRLLVPYHARRYDGDFLKVQELIASGALGPVNLIRMGTYVYSRRNDWQTLRRLGGGQLVNWGSHKIDQALTLLDGKVVSLFADLKNTISAGDAEDHIKVVLKGASGLVVDIEIASACAIPQPSWLVIGKYGTAVANRGGCLEWKYYDPAAVPEREPAREEAGPRSYDFSEHLPWQTGSCDYKTHEQAHSIFYRAFAKALAEGGPMPISPEEGRRVIALQEEIRRLAGEPEVES